MKANNFAANQPTVVLYTEDLDNTQVLQGDDFEPKVFANLKEAQKYVSQHVNPAIHMFLEFVNEVPVLGAGDRENTNNRKCLKCDGYLRPSEKTSQSAMADGSQMQVVEFDCPKCDLGE